MAFGQKDSDAHDVLLQCGHSGVFSFDESAEEIENNLNELFVRFKEDDFEINSDNIGVYDRKKLTGDLAYLMNKLVS